MSQAGTGDTQVIWTRAVQFALDSLVGAAGQQKLWALLCACLPRQQNRSEACTQWQGEQAFLHSTSLYAEVISVRQQHLSAFMQHRARRLFPTEQAPVWGVQSCQWGRGTSQQWHSCGQLHKTAATWSKGPHHTSGRWVVLKCIR